MPLREDLLDEMMQWRGWLETALGPGIRMFRNAGLRAHF
jgi:hypothetical protein